MISASGSKPPGRRAASYPLRVADRDLGQGSRGVAPRRLLRHGGVARTAPQAAVRGLLLAVRNTPYLRRGLPRVGGGGRTDRLAQARWSALAGARSPGDLRIRRAASHGRGHTRCADRARRKTARFGRPAQGPGEGLAAPRRILLRPLDDGSRGQTHKGRPATDSPGSASPPDPRLRIDAIVLSQPRLR